jgi:hypothetical protein
MAEGEGILALRGIGSALKRERAEDCLGKGQVPPQGAVLQPFEFKARGSPGGGGRATRVLIPALLLSFPLSRAIFKNFTLLSIHRLPTRCVYPRWPKQALPVTSRRTRPNHVT